MSPWEKVLEQPDAQGHLVQLYTDEPALTRNVGHYLWQGIEQGEGLLVIAGAEHTAAFRNRLLKLGADPDAAVADGRLAFFDAQETLARFFVNGQPDWSLFVTVVGSAMRQVHGLHQHSRLRAYGEMVGILWQSRQFAAAIRLEHFWNKLLSRGRFSLYCAYQIDVFGKDFHASAVDGLLCAHTHLIPAESKGHLDTAIDDAIREVLGSAANQLLARMKTTPRPSWAVMSSGEGRALWLRENAPDQADEILSRARELYGAASRPAAA
jgi:hypothetical protein